jgi:hypothetical protein
MGAKSLPVLRLTFERSGLSDSVMGLHKALLPGVHFWHETVLNLTELLRPLAEVAAKIADCLPPNWVGRVLIPHSSTGTPPPTHQALTGTARRTP